MIVDPGSLKTHVVLYVTPSLSLCSICFYYLLSKKDKKNEQTKTEQEKMIR